MNDGVATLPPAVGTVRQQAGQFWRGLTAREKQAALVALVALVALFVWMVLLQPAMRTLRAAPVELERIDRQLQQTQLAAAEAATLRGAAPVSPAQASSALRAATERLGASAKLVVQGDRATLAFTGVRFEDLRAWMAETRSAARARPVEAQLLKAARGYSGSITVVLGAAS